MPTETELLRVVPGDEIKASSQNLIMEAIERRPTEAQTNQIVTDKVAALIGTAPEHLDTLEEIAKAIADNSTVVETLNSAITSKADKTYVDTQLGLKANKVDLDGKVNVTTLNETMKTSDKFQTMVWDPTRETLVVTHKDGTKKEAKITTTAVYS